MTLVLHFSDLHLVGAERSHPIGDHKVGLVPRHDRTTHHQVMRLTLERLGQRLTAEGRRLDAIVMSGDIADKNDEGGFQAFLELLDALKGALGDDAMPAPGRILAVPGNHDVTSGLRPGAPERYARFRAAMEDAGFVTPLLEGVRAEPPPLGGTERHLLRVGRVEFVPIDSSGYAQVRLDTGIGDALWARLERSLPGFGADDNEVEAFARLRTVDAARVSDRQMENLRSMLEQVRAHEEGGEGFQPPVRVAVLHHQLLPVSTREEVKPFESFTNLELLRQFLVENGFSVVLHGHKHAPFTYVDHVASHARADDPPRQIRVISGPSPSGPGLNPDDVFRLLTFDVDACTLELERVPLVLPGQPGRPGERSTLSFTPPGAAVRVRTPNVSVFDGERVGSVYARMVASLAAEHGEVGNVLCHVETSPGLTELSALYTGFDAGNAAAGPAVGEAGREHGLDGKPLERFQELVEWWQGLEPTGTVRRTDFTHGSRILRYNGYLDQLAEIAAALREDPSTTRGVIVLLQPGADRVSQLSHPFPSFCLAQFLVRTPGDGRPPALDCVAFFRKLEVRYWWLVNVAELANLQRQVVSLALAGADARDLPDLTAGSITTFAARAHAGVSPPRVQVKRIDWFHAVARERLFAMVGALVWPDMPDQDALANDWRDVMLDLVPAPRPDRDGIAVAIDGLKYVLNELEKHVSPGADEGDAELRALKASLRDLLYENERYANDQNRGRVDQARHEKWKEEVTRLVHDVLERTFARIRRRRGEALVG